jgi:hypothetical protein
MYFFELMSLLFDVLLQLTSGLLLGYRTNMRVFFRIIASFNFTDQLSGDTDTAKPYETKPSVVTL